MNVQSLSIAVPAGCPNQCKFCVSKTHESSYENKLWDLSKKILLPEAIGMIFDRMSFARDNGCNTLLFTGEGEPMLNKPFIDATRHINAGMKSPFIWMEMQTSGYDLTDENLEWMNSIGIKTVSLSVSDIFTDKYNNDIMQAKFPISVLDTCKSIKRHGMNLRLSLNMTSRFNPHSAKNIFDRLKLLGADMATFRLLYAPADSQDEISAWVRENRASDDIMLDINRHISNNGNELERLPFGARRFSVNDISVVIDSDCMSKDAGDNLKYLILRPNGRLYTRWDDKGSLLF